MFNYIFSSWFTCFGMYSTVCIFGILKFNLLNVCKASCYSLAFVQYKQKLPHSVLFCSSGSTSLTLSLVLGFAVNNIHPSILLWQCSCRGLNTKHSSPIRGLHVSIWKRHWTKQVLRATKGSLSGNTSQTWWCLWQALSRWASLYDEWPPFHSLSPH